MVFPAAKLFSVAIRQVSKPMASYMQKKAQNSPRFKAICVGIASRYNAVEQIIINRFYGRSNKAAPVRKLNETKAIELGATVFGEFVIFGVAAIALGFEYRRSLMKEAAKERELLERLYVLEAQILQLQAENDRVLQSLFPHEQHAREEVDVNIDQGPGWLSWLAQPITGLFSTEGSVKDGDGDAKTGISVHATQGVVSGVYPSRHIPPPPGLERAPIPKQPSEVGFLSLPSLASEALPTFPLPKAFSDAVASLSGNLDSLSHLRGADLPHFMREQRHSPDASEQGEKTDGRLCEAAPVADDTACERVPRFAKSDSVAGSSASKLGGLYVPKLWGPRAPEDDLEKNGGTGHRG
ncbi:optic atrophy 3 protein (opa3) protein [Toxoplasma gondii GAB2-2007-GAL-DOM2]|uniref:OPA3 domain-containing protein n=6 Tax=Toxoplasma gondii TaxID=5811 RepID=B9QJ27_TOXGV|nr:optic atrophy 3 protein (opa3) protein [Toxoplasma gondii VEG]KFG35518.1 optic atrophy 3 protein (opa3) protein [Toxoplasma gondii GAB2-2007-GAL-DOM2]KFG46900.1 optic atrophy 3 protein (opa3) protein [Toxoplasma gondii p89]KFH06610.1 optic atrophy 3 protein (opa3) protein [Toxoplasma gondii VAND]PIL98017.1 optic atrophy 3 protein (opa3) protein [Toxoplasma gondii COUG]RQX68593.1 optic atrophy 3 protein (opa3) protein [Toxoplasma gondii CAST]